MNKHQLFKKTQWLIGSVLLLTLPGLLSAAPGVISSEPLQTSASAPSNVMFVIDSSGSMNIISPEPIPTSYSYTCSNSNSLIPGGNEVELNIVGGLPEIDFNGDVRPLGNSGNSTWCFDPALTYNANLNTLLNIGWGWPSVPYSGAYLNWYFDTTTDSGTDTWAGKGYKPGTRNRLEVAQVSLNGLIDTLKNINVGLSEFDWTAGAQIDVAIQPITSSFQTTLKTAVNNIVANGGTPLSETLRDLGRYFSNGDGTNGSSSGTCGGLSNTNITIHPDDNLPTDTPAGLREDVACTTLLANRITLSGPIQYYCQKNFVVMLTDGFPTGDRNVDVHLRDYDQDCTAAAQAAGSYNCGIRDTKDYDPGPDSDYWDDVAQALYEVDLRPDLNDKKGQAYKNNLITYTIGFADQQIQNLQLIKDAGRQGGGESYYASSTTQLQSVLANIQASVDAQSGTAAAVTFNSSTLSSQSAVYQALFNTQRWSGKLHSIPLDGFTGEILTGCTLGDDNCWRAEDMLDNQSPSSRNILTFNPVKQSGIAFEAPADYTTITSTTNSYEIPKDLVDDLCASHAIPWPCDATTAADSSKKSENQTYIETLIAYLRGDRTHENKTSSIDFRIRTNVLGDIVNSSPIYVGKPSLGWPITAPFPEPPATTADPDNTYSTWAMSSIKDRMPVVYVAANDGMLHGFRTMQTDPVNNSADAGEEVLAYIPTGTFSSANTQGLHYLADPNYQHRFYVDLNPSLSDVYIYHKDSSGVATSSKEWRTVLVGGQGAGGNTMYMLDVTDPSRFSEANAKELVEWEFTHPNLGKTFSKPVIAMMNNGRFAAIFGNGYNSSDNPTPGDCKAKLFVVFLDGGIDGTWTAGTDYLEFDTGVGSTTDCNGLSSPAVVDLNSDKVADRVYAGDLYGNLWAFDLCDYQSGTGLCNTVTTNWGLANASPIMTTKDNASPAVRQPITVKPVVSRDPASTGRDDLLVVFGTGQYLTANDITDTQVQTLYGVRDYNALSNGRSNWGLDPRKNADKFKQQSLVEETCAAAGCTGLVRRIATPVATLNSNDNGWYIDLDVTGSDGERIVVNPKIRSDIVFFNTMIPDSRKCYAGGNGWLMSVNLINGGEPDKQVFDLNNDGVINVQDQQNGNNPVGVKVFAIPAESTFLGEKQYTPDSEGNINVRMVNIGKNQREGRMSWKEIYADDL